jgi:hypothetical protein
MAAPHEIGSIDDTRRLHFLEWFSSNARFEPSKESPHREICIDPQLDKMVNTLLEGIYMPVIVSRK